MHDFSYVSSTALQCSLCVIGFTSNYTGQICKKWLERLPHCISPSLTSSTRSPGQESFQWCQRRPEQLVAPFLGCLTHPTAKLPMSTNQYVVHKSASWAASVYRGSCDGAWHQRHFLFLLSFLFLKGQCKEGLIWLLLALLMKPVPCVAQSIPCCSVQFKQLKLDTSNASDKDLAWFHVNRQCMLQQILKCPRSSTEYRHGECYQCTLTAAETSYADWADACAICWHQARRGLHLR